MSQLPTVSFVMPIRNAQHSIAKAVQSIRAQSFSNWELIAVNDGSTDATSAILQLQAHEDARVRIIETPPKGIVHALNLGIAHARSGWIARMDADDYCLPERLAKQLTLAQQQPELSIISSRVRYGGDQKGFRLYVQWLNGLIESEAIEQARFIESPFAHPSVLLRKDELLKVGGYREGNFPEDYDLWLRMFASGAKAAKCPEELLVWNDSAGRLTRVDDRYSTEAFFACKAPHLYTAIQKAAQGRGVYIWGAGRTTRKRLQSLLDLGLELRGWVDVDQRKQNQRIGDIAVIAPEELPDRKEAFVIAAVGSRGARQKIEAFLYEKCFVNSRDFICCA